MANSTLNSATVSFLPDNSLLSSINLGFRTKSGLVPVLDAADIKFRKQEELGYANFESLSLDFLKQPSGTLMATGIKAQLSHERLLSIFDDINVIRDTVYSPDKAILLAGFRSGTGNTVSITLNGVEQETFQVGKDMSMYVKMINLSGELAVISISGDCYISDCTMILR